jgi:hypothetical protein
MVGETDHPLKKGTRKGQGNPYRSEITFALDFLFCCLVAICFAGDSRFTASGFHLDSVLSR